MTVKQHIGSKLSSDRHSCSFQLSQVHNNEHCNVMQTVRPVSHLHELLTKKIVLNSSQKRVITSINPIVIQVHDSFQLLTNIEKNRKKTEPPYNTPLNISLKYVYIISI